MNDRAGSKFAAFVTWMMWWGLKQHIKVEKLHLPEIYTWIFENGITNFTPRPGWTRCHRQRVHLRLAVYFLGGGLSRLVPSNSTGTGLTDHLHLGSPHLNPGGGRVGQNSGL